MRTMPLKLRKELAADPFMKKCVYTGSTENVSWEHCWIYAGKQINERWAIVPLSRELNTSGIDARVKNFCRLVSLKRATPGELAKYHKVDWAMLKANLERMFAEPVTQKEFAKEWKACCCVVNA